MDRRDFTRQTLGAIFGVSVIPAFGQKPKLTMQSGPKWKAVYMCDYTPRPIEGIGFKITHHVPPTTRQRPV
jgi:hypothetical protein